MTTQVVTNLMEPIPDLGDIRLDFLATSLAISNSSGLGLLPVKNGQLGWFGKPEILTVKIDCGCGSGDDCSSPQVIYVEKRGDAYHPFYDTDGDLSVCSYQTCAVRGKCDTVVGVIEYIEASRADSHKGHQDEEAIVRAAVESIIAAKIEDQIREISEKLKKLPEPMYDYVAARLAAALKAHKEKKSRDFQVVLRRYLPLIEADMDPDDIVAQMKKDGVDAETVSFFMESIERARSATQLFRLLSDSFFGRPALRRPAGFDLGELDDADLDLGDLDDFGDDVAH